METQPSESALPQEVAVPVVATVQDKNTVPPSNHWKTIVSALLVVLVGGVGAYFLITRSSHSLPNTILPTTTPGQTVTQQPSSTENNSQQIRNFTVNDIKNAYMYMPNLTNSLYLMPDNNGGVLLKDGLATFSYCVGDSSCNGDAIKTATVTLSTITLQKDLLPAKDRDGAMITVFDFGNGQKEYYLNLFVIVKNENDNIQNDYKNRLSFPFSKNLGKNIGTVQNIDISKEGEIAINFVSSTGTTRRTFVMEDSKRFSDLTEITADATKKIYDDQKVGYSFAYPQIVNISRPQSLRATVLESTLKTRPIYYAQECGLQPTFADSIIPFWAVNASGTVSLSASLAVHSIDATTSVYLTSSLYGYSPADWDKIKEKVSIKEYVDAINSKVAVPGRKTSFETIQGYTVRHILPFSIGRPCDTQSREQYQWVKGGLLFNLLFVESKNLPSSTQQKEELIASILSSLRLK